MRLPRRSALTGLAASTLPLATARAEPPLVVFAASSLTDAMQDIGSVWRERDHPVPRFSFAASSTLIRQIEQGAPANIFASADEEWMEYGVKQGLIATDTRRTLLQNTLVIVMRRDVAHPVAITKDLDIDALLGKDGRLAVGGPSVPAGIYAREALTKLGLWDKVANRLAPADNVRAALRLVGRGEAPAGIVYATDAELDQNVAVIGTFPESSHSPITYPFAVTKAGDTPEARAFLAFLGTPPAQRLFARRGFERPAS